MPKLPDKLSSDSFQAAKINQIIDYLRHITPKKSATMNLHHGVGGFTFDAQPPKPSKSNTPSNWNYRGVWQASPAAAYMTYDVVQVGSGTSSGMYLSGIDNNASAPDSGFGWIQISSSSGTWL